MKTEFLSLSVPLQSSPVRLRDTIELTLRQVGEPLRWAVTSVDQQAQTAQVEAVVTVAATGIQQV